MFFMEVHVDQALLSSIVIESAHENRKPYPFTYPMSTYAPTWRALPLDRPRRRRGTKGDANPRWLVAC